MTERHPPLRDPHLEEVAHWHPIEGTAMKKRVAVGSSIGAMIETYDFIGVPSMGCQLATSARWGSRSGGCRSVMVISDDQEDSEGNSRYALSLIPNS